MNRSPGPKESFNFQYAAGVTVTSASCWKMAPPRPLEKGQRNNQQKMPTITQDTQMLSCCLQQRPSVYTGAVYSCEAAGMNLNTSLVCCGKGVLGSQGHYPHHLTLPWTYHQKGLQCHTSLIFLFLTPLPIFADCHCCQCTGLLWTISRAYLSG